MTPQRIQLSRKKGWKMPPNTVKVDRSTKWGNPFTVTDKYAPGTKCGGQYFAVPSVAEAIECFREMFALRSDFVAEAIAELKGKNLACWCKIGEPCHADVLLELANKPQDTQD